MKYILFTFISLVTLFGPEMKAQSKKWTLQECIQYAVENSPRKGKQDQQNSIYHQYYLEAIGALIPSVNGSVSTNFGFGRSLNEDNTYSDNNSFSNDYSLNSSWMLFDGLANINRVKMQKVNKLVGKEKLQETKDMIAYETMEEFFNVLYYKEMVDLAQQQLQHSTENYNQVKRMEELGIKGFPDVAEMRAKEATDQYNLTRQKNLLIIAIIKLKEKMNFPIDEDLDIENYLSDKLIAKTTDSPLEIFDQSVNYLPKALAAEASYEAYKLSYKMAKGNLFPKISLGAGISTNFYRKMDGSDYDSFTTQLKNKRGHYVGFSLSIPIFNGFSKTSNLKRSKAEMMIAKHEKEEVMRTLYSEIEQAVADMNGQADEYYQAKEQVEYMSIAHEVNQRKYQEGLVSALELHTSDNRVFQAKVEELNAQLKFYLKQKLVDYYKGEPLVY